MNLHPADYFASLLRCSPRHFSERIAKQPGFPAPVHGGKMLWYEDEVEEYLRTTRAYPRGRRQTGCNTSTTS